MRRAMAGAGSITVTSGPTISAIRGTTNGKWVQPRHDRIRAFFDHRNQRLFQDQACICEIGFSPLSIASTRPGHVCGEDLHIFGKFFNQRMVKFSLKGGRRCQNTHYSIMCLFMWLVLPPVPSRQKSVEDMPPAVLSARQQTLCCRQQRSCCAPLLARKSVIAKEKS